MSREPIIDVLAVAQTFSNGLASAVVDRNGNARLVLYIEQADEETGERNRLVSARLILPQNALPAMARMILSAMTPEGRKHAEAWHAGVLAHA